MAGTSKKLRALVVLFTTFLLQVGIQIEKVEGALRSGFLISEKGCECISDCGKRGHPYDWCYVDKENPKCPVFRFRDMCTPDSNYTVESLATDGVVSSYGVPCRSECKQEGTFTSYFTCETIKPWNSYSWDYCSPTPGRDYRGKKCSTKCDYNGHHPYKWCYLEEGSWGYCSK